MNKEIEEFINGEPPNKDQPIEICFSPVCLIGDVVQFVPTSELNHKYKLAYAKVRGYELVIEDGRWVNYYLLEASYSKAKAEDIAIVFSKRREVTPC